MHPAVRSPGCSDRRGRRPIGSATGTALRPPRGSRVRLLPPRAAVPALDPAHGLPGRASLAASRRRYHCKRIRTFCTLRFSDGEILRETEFLQLRGELIGGFDLRREGIELGCDRIGIDAVEIADLRLQDR